MTSATMLLVNANGDSKDITLSQGTKLEYKSCEGKYTKIFNYYGENDEVQYDSRNNPVEGARMFPSDKAYNAFTKLVGDDNSLSIEDLKSEKLDMLEKEFGLTISRDKLKEGELNIRFDNNEEITIDLVTEKELTEFKNKTTDSTTKLTRKIAPKVKEGLLTVATPIWNEFCRIMDIATERLSNWQPF